MLPVFPSIMSNPSTLRTASSRDLLRFFTRSDHPVAKPSREARPIPSASLQARPFVRAFHQPLSRMLMEMKPHLPQGNSVRAKMPFPHTQSPGAQFFRGIFSLINLLEKQQFLRQSTLKCYFSNTQLFTGLLLCSSEPIV
jgi:hypothetical protein